MSRDLIWQGLAAIVSLLVGLYLDWLTLTLVGVLAFLGLYIVSAIILAALQGISEGIIDAYRYRRLS
jgi:hypothetical protein